MKSARKRLTYANVMSSLAVFLVLAGGSAFAASQLGKNTVGTKQLKKEAVTLAKINAAAKKSLQGATGPAGAKGATGPQGPKGDKGEKGDTGPSTGPAGGVLTGNYPNPGLGTGVVTTTALADNAVTASKIAEGGVTAGKVSINVRSQNTEIAKETVGLASSACLAGEKLIGIGEAWLTPNKANAIEAQFYFGTIGFVRAYNATAALNTLSVQAVCLG